MKPYRWIAVILTLIVLPSLAAAADVDPRELAFRSYHAAYFQGDDVKSRAHMRIEDEQGRVRSRELTILRKSLSEDRQKYYAYFHQPPDIRRMVFLVWTHPGQDDDRWLYLPSIDLVQRITGSQKRNSFAGSNFTYEDMTGRFPGNDSFEYRGTQQLDGTTVHVLKGTPKNPDMVEFSYYEAFINTETYLPEKAIFYTPQGNKHRTLTLEEVKVIEGFPTPVKQRAVNHQTGSHTVVEMSDVDYNVGIPERVFEQRYLRRPPTPWVQP